MPSSTENVKVGVCQIFFDDVDLGYTKGGVEVEVTTETYETNVDQFGNTPIGEYINGRQIMVRVPLAETTLENLVAIMPGAVLVGTVNKRVDVNTGVGTDLRSVAKELRLHPVGKAANDTSEDFVIPLAATAGALRFSYKLDEERVYNVEFKGYPASVTGKLFSYGHDVTT